MIVLCSAQYIANIFCDAALNSLRNKMHGSQEIGNLTKFILTLLVCVEVGRCSLLFWSPHVFKQDVLEFSQKKGTM